MGNSVFTPLLLLYLSQWKIIPIWPCWPPNKWKLEFKSQPVNSTLLHTINISPDPRVHLFKVFKEIRVPFLQWWRIILPYMLTTFQIQMLLFGNLANTSGDDLFLKFNQLLSLDGRFKPLFLKSKNKVRILRFMSNPNIRFSIIMRNCLEGILPLHMIIDKRSKSPQLDIS